MNKLGKGLVFAHLVFSLLAVSWATAVYLDFTDWGWQVPRKELDQAIASEYDKSAAAVAQALQVRGLTQAAVAPAETLLAEAESAFWQNHLYYAAQLERLKSAPGPIEVQALKEPGLPLTPPGKETGRPQMGDKLANLTKSERAYQADRTKLVGKDGEIDRVNDEIRKINERAGAITFNLTGKDLAGKQVTFGIYDLTEAEYLAMTNAKNELARIKPRWAEVRNEAQRFARRRQDLELRLSQYEKAAAPRGAQP